MNLDELIHKIHTERRNVLEADRLNRERDIADLIRDTVERTRDLITADFYDVCVLAFGVTREEAKERLLNATYGGKILPDVKSIGRERILTARDRAKQLSLQNTSIGALARSVTAIADALLEHMAQRLNQAADEVLWGLINTPDGHQSPYWTDRDLAVTTAAASVIVHLRERCKRLEEEARRDRT